MGRIRDAIAGLFHEIGYSLSGASKQIKSDAQVHPERHGSLQDPERRRDARKSLQRAVSLDSHARERTSPSSPRQNRPANANRRDSLDPTLLTQLRDSSCASTETISAPPDPVHAAANPTDTAPRFNQWLSSVQTPRLRKQTERPTEDSRPKLSRSNAATQSLAERSQGLGLQMPCDHLPSNQHRRPTVRLVNDDHAGDDYAGKDTERPSDYDLRGYNLPPKPYIAPTRKARAVTAPIVPHEPRTRIPSATQAPPPSRRVQSLSSHAPSSPARLNRSKSTGPNSSSINDTPAQDNEARVETHNDIAPSETSELSNLTDLNQPEYQAVIDDGVKQTTARIHAMHSERRKQRARQNQIQDDYVRFNAAFNAADTRDQHAYAERAALARAHSAAAPISSRGVAVHDFASGPFELPTAFNAASPALSSTTSQGRAAAHYIADMSSDGSAVSLVPFSEDGDEDEDGDVETPRADQGEFTPQTSARMTTPELENVYSKSMDSL